MNNQNDEEVLALLDRLLERLQQMGCDQNGSHYHFVYIVAPHAPLAKGRGTASQGEVPEENERIRQSIALLMKEQYGDEPLFNLQGHWQAVYRILVDKGYCRDSDFDGFDTFIRRVMPDMVNKPYKKDSVKQISQTDFSLPFYRWHYDPQTSATRKPYDRMRAVAIRFKGILEENGL